MTPVEQFLSTYIVLLLVTAIGFLARPTLHFIRAKTIEVETNLGPVKLQMIKEFAAMIVKAAEQSGLEAALLSNPAAKEQWAIETLQKIVDSHGWEIHVAQIETAIKAAFQDALHGSQTVSVSVQATETKPVDQVVG